ncbi:MAG: MFS transporter [Gammaproteobacteria bacterium]
MSGIFTLIRYGLFAFPAAIALLTMQVYLPTYLSQTSGLSFTLIGVIFLLARLVDTISDPLIGYWSDRTPERLGKRRIWLVVGTPIFMVIFYGLLFIPYTPVLLFAMLSLWYIAGTALIVPYYAWGAEIQSGYNQYTRFTSSRAIFGLLGSLAALILPTLIITDNNIADTIELSISLAAVSFVIALAFIYTVPNHTENVPEQTRLTSAFKVFKSGSLFNTLIFSQLVNGVANALPATLFILFCTHVLNAPDMVGPLLVLYFLMAAITIPIWGWAGNKWGKENCWRVAMSVAAIVFMGTVFVDQSNVTLFVWITIITGLMAGADLNLPPSMLADLVDQDEQDNNSRRTGVYYAVWGTTSKLTFAIAIGIAFPLLDAGTFLSTATGVSTAEATPVQDTASAINPLWLTLIYAFIPACLKLLSVWSLRKYRIHH